MKEEENKLQIFFFFFGFFIRTHTILLLGLRSNFWGLQPLKISFLDDFFVLFFCELMGCENTINLQNFLESIGQDVNVGFSVALSIFQQPQRNFHPSSLWG